MPSGPRYIPIDELLQQLPVRALRALRWFDWVTAEELGDALCLPPPRDSLDRNNLVVSLMRLAKRGQLQQRSAPRGHYHGAKYQYRITPLGRSAVEQSLQRSLR